MTCNDSAGLVGRYADDELDERERRALDAHLAACAACRSALAEQLDVLNVLRAAPEVAVPAGFETRLGARLDAAATLAGAADWRAWSFRAAPIAAALLLLAALAQAGASRPGEVSAAAVQAWMAGGDAETVPATAVFLQADVNSDALLQAVLTTSATAALEVTSDER
jgi:anti-sigma factor RsiW